MHVLAAGVHEDYASAATHQNHLTKLRGARSAQIRRNLAAYCGVKVGLELGRLRRAKRILAGADEEEEEEEEEEEGVAVALVSVAESHGKSGSERHGGSEGQPKAQRGAAFNHSIGMAHVTAAAVWALVFVYVARKRFVLRARK